MAAHHAERPDDVGRVDEHAAEEKGSEEHVEVIDEPHDHLAVDGEHLGEPLERPERDGVPDRQRTRTTRS